MNSHQLRIFFFAIIASLTSFILIIYAFDFSTANQVFFHKKEKKPVSMIFFGDMMLDRNVARRLKENGEEYPFQNIKNEIIKPDIAVANLEGVFTDNDSVSLKDNEILRFTFDKKYISLLQYLGFDSLSQANNHDYDFGVSGAIQSKLLLAGAGISTFGDFANLTPAGEFFNVRGKKVALIGFNEFSYNNFDKVIEDIKKAKEENDYVVVMPHWGVEYQKTPSTFQKKKGREFIDAGADAVIGAHPHVIEPIEIYNGKPIFYSLGNFVFDQDFSKETMEGLAVGISIYKEKIVFDLKPFDIISSQVSWKLGDFRKETLDFLADNSFADPQILDQIREGSFVLELNSL